MFDLSGNQVGTVTREWDFVAEYTKADKFRIQFLRNLPVVQKIFIFATTFLIDLEEFEEGYRDDDD